MKLLNNISKLFEVNNLKAGAKGVGVRAKGFYLAGTFIIFVVLVISALAAHQIQYRLRAVANNSKPVPVWAIQTIVGILDGQKQIIQQLKGDIDTLNLDISIITLDVEEARDNADKTYRGLIEAIASSKHLLLRSDSEKFATTVKVRDSISEAHSILVELNKLQDNPEIAVTELISKLQDAIIEHSKSQDIKISFETKLFNQREKLNRLNESRQKTEFKQIDELNSKTKQLLVGSGKENDVTNEEVQFVINAANEANSLRGGMLSYMPVFFLVTLQPEVLTLVLVIVMGVLGGLIDVAQMYVKNEIDEGWTPYLFRPLLGAVAALAIYILAKAGVLVMSDAGMQGHNVGGLSPFFVSFLAIISGLMAENAISNIRAAAKNFLRPVENPLQERWANKVAEEVKASKGAKKSGDLANLLNEQQGEVEDWINGRKPVPLGIQKAIGTWLGKHPRDLFTDQAPT